MKRITLLAAFCLLGLSAYCQLDFGVKGGLNLTNITLDMETVDYKIKSNPGSQIGYHVGGLMRASLFGIFFQPELVFTSIATEYTVTDLNTSLEGLADQRIGRVDIPLLFGAKLGSLRFGVGPVASFVVSNESNLTDITGYEATLKSATIGYQLGAGLNIWKIGVDIRYEGNLSQLGDHSTVGGQQVNFDSRAKQVIFSVSYIF